MEKVLARANTVRAFVYFWFCVLTTAISVSCFADSVAQNWADKNPWFGKNTEMTEYALEVHEDLILSKKTQVGSSQYYDQLNEIMRLRFPNYFDNALQQVGKSAFDQESMSQNNAELVSVIGGCLEDSIECLHIEDIVVSINNHWPKLTEQVHFFLSGPGDFTCPDGYKNYDSGNIILEDIKGNETRVSACATFNETLINKYSNDSLRLRLHFGDECPRKNIAIFYTEKIVSCQSYERNENKLIEPEKNLQAVNLADTQSPSINVIKATTIGKQGLVKVQVHDNAGVAEVTVDGNIVTANENGIFEYRTFVPANGISVRILATDLTGLTSVMTVSLERSVSTATTKIAFDRLNPLGKSVDVNRNALALIVGVADYENTPAKAIFADSDALMFRDYASEILGIPENRIKTLVNDNADISDVLLSVHDWLSRAVKQGKSDVFIFFAGHGLASDDGEKMYLLPYDGSPRLLSRTALPRDELFADIVAANPRSVTVFLDTCYSGSTRGPEILIASRPIAIRAKKQAVPEGFTVMTAASSDQTAKPLEEAKHGMFSYFLMKGMEGDADANKDNHITAGELHAYVQQNVIQQSSGSQTPEIQGDADRVLVRFH